MEGHHSPGSRELLALRNPMRPAEKNIPGLEQTKYDFRKHPGTVTVEEGTIIHMCPNGEKEQNIM